MPATAIQPTLANKNVLDSDNFADIDLQLAVVVDESFTQYTLLLTKQAKSRNILHNTYSENDNIAKDRAWHYF